MVCSRAKLVQVGEGRGGITFPVAVSSGEIRLSVVGRTNSLDVPGGLLILPITIYTTEEEGCSKVL